MDLKRLKTVASGVKLKSEWELFFDVKCVSTI